MEFSYSLEVFGPILQICLIDLLLSGDNAILIAMACQHLPEGVRQKAVLMGTGAAVLFRVLLTFAATLALRVPYLKLIGAVLLLLIAIELLGSDTSKRKTPAAQDQSEGIWKAIVLIVVADAVMSLDNVVAVAAAAQDNLIFLFLGLLISVPILVFSSLLVVRLLDAHPVLIEAGAVLLGWIAGKTAVSDPAIARTLDSQSFGLVALAPRTCCCKGVCCGHDARRKTSNGSHSRPTRPALWLRPRCLPRLCRPRPQRCGAGRRRRPFSPKAMRRSLRNSRTWIWRSWPASRRHCWACWGPWYTYFGMRSRRIDVRIQPPQFVRYS